MSSKERLEAERDEYLDLAKRTQAEFENFRKRIERERQGDQLRGCSQMIKEMLPALDALYLSLSSLQADKELDGFAQGIVMVSREIEEAFQRVGVEVYSPTGQPFDPELQEVISTVDAKDGESGVVVQTVERGYRLGEIIIRPARVVVAQ